MENFISGLLIEWSYHVVNIIIILFFSVYGIFATFRKKMKAKGKEVKMSVFLSQFDVKEFLKYFFILFIIYTAYILWRSSN